MNDISLRLSWVKIDILNKNLIVFFWSFIHVFFMARGWKSLLCQNQGSHSIWTSVNSSENAPLHVLALSSSLSVAPCCSVVIFTKHWWFCGLLWNEKHWGGGLNQWVAKKSEEDFRMSDQTVGETDLCQVLVEPEVRGNCQDCLDFWTGLCPGI